MEDIYNLNKFEITQVIEKQNFPKYRSEQIWRYLYKNEVESFDEMKNISTKLQSLQSLDPIVRNIQWTILGNAHETNIDINGRMLIRIPNDLQRYAEIEDKKQIALVGMGKKFEVWNVDSWEMRQTGGSLSTEILDVVLPESIKSMSF